MNKFLPMVLSLSFASLVQAGQAPLISKIHSLNHGLFKVHVGVQAPTSGRIAADILYVHGLGDRLDNHRPLFDEWNKQGLRVIAFDLPSHGDTNGGLKNNIDLWSFTELAALANQVLALEGDTRIPLLVSGWSTGGLIVTRMLQMDAFKDQPRSPVGAILFAPAVAPHLPLVGDRGTITLETLTRNEQPPHFGEIKPTSPLHHLIFSSYLTANMALACSQTMPLEVPVLTIVGGDEEDLYVGTTGVKDWARKQRTENHVYSLGLQCAGAFHELDNEPAAVGAQVRGAAAVFARNAIRRSRSGTFDQSVIDIRALAGPCRQF